MRESLTLNDQLLIDAGFEFLTAEQASLALGAIFEALEHRVGTELSRDLSDAQLRAFEQLIDADDDPGATRWLEVNRPRYREIVAAELDAVVRRLAAARAVRADEISSLTYGDEKRDA
ncbi:DUF5663 domain-containing protein [Planococcus sp. APC 4015]|nr:DUF5663 domain-containing protein [Planococcus sp. APC 4015]